MRTPKFTVGQRVRVRAMFPPGHIRTPYYTVSDWRLYITLLFSSALSTHEEAKWHAQGHADHDRKCHRVTPPHAT
jgi:hypothetical protein